MGLFLKKSYQLPSESINLSPLGLLMICANKCFTYQSLQLLSRSGNYSTCHVHNHDKDKHTEQATCEDEQVLRFQTFELHGSSDAFIDVVITHKAKD